VVAAPGELQARRVDADGSRVERYRLRRAIDIAWAASTGFDRVRVRSGTIDIDVFAPRGHRVLAQRQAELLGAGLSHFERAYGPYPHPRLVLVLPPRAGFGAAGMEYPGLIVGWPVAPWSELNPAAWPMQDIVTSHELAHQWFAMLLASNEVDIPLLDEGLAEWAGLDFLRTRYGRAYWQRAIGLPTDMFEFERAAFSRLDPPPSSLEPAYRYRAHTLAAAVYMRPALALESVRRTWGAARLSATLGAYARANRFAHPTLRDLWGAFDRGYYAGFSEQVLRPALEGEAADTSIAGALSGPALKATREHAPAPPLLARLLLWAQILLAGLGP
jgi:aminopeptidase N